MGRTITDILQMFWKADEKEQEEEKVLEAYNKALKPSNYIKELEALFKYKGESTPEETKKKLDIEKKNLETVKIIREDISEKATTNEKEIGE